MEAIAEYLFDNCDDIKEGHYLSLMNLLSEARKAQTVIQPINRDRYDPNRSINLMINVSSPSIEVYEPQWNRLEEVLDTNNVDEFMRYLSGLAVGSQVIRGAQYEYRFSLPESLTPRVRQKLHIMSKVSNKFITKTHYIGRNNRTGEWKKKLNIFIVHM